MTGTMELRVVGIHALSFWKWQCKDDSCRICTEPHDYPCPKYDTSANEFGHCVRRCLRPGDSCPPAYGVCGHSFHLHCINRWIARGRETDNSCPLCRQPFQFAPAQSAADTPQEAVMSAISSSAELRGLSGDEDAVETAGDPHQ
eukprot:Blabericola_migrator_1__5882@NODE_297_length_10209_cov_136_062907_g244_i0_p8_GENE_NODE_297_length_10209_cov_136_062907_g244_i0NODE_297_length_10209_cov_136_062907_g244_i0_p8_ORF_typecomplete_len144_score8_41zfANAPC11/PF12861_7/2_6e19zfrbx1/PF12678_7/5_3e13zfC3HC4_2/PF13923_6/2_5e03zfC3HC4_2/PF13923_6/1_2e06zfRING_2/PF13639_6/0_00024zfC3HC4_4/PF15227_6/1_1e03zfC3HC4_4/PF15227_6/5e03zfC3HC4_4/PF15227_6/4_7e05zfC3HC4/PF00097_25/0_00082zfRING_5/PF14634_6/0_0011Rad50_zn_hook/PF04423_14/0_0015zfC3HC4_